MKYNMVLSLFSQLAGIYFVTSDIESLNLKRKKEKSDVLLCAPVHAHFPFFLSPFGEDALSLVIGGLHAPE